MEFYLIILEKKRRRPKIYIGSRTDKTTGITARLKVYDSSSTFACLPDLVGKALADGYRIIHKDMLCWADIPDLGMRVPLRSLLFILETALSLAV